MSVSIIVKGYPRLSETFIAQEILAFQNAGLALQIVSLRHPTERSVHEMHRHITAPVLYLPEYLQDDPARVAAARRIAKTLPGYAAAKAAYDADWARDRSVSRARRWGQAAVLAAELPADTRLLYVHYLHTPASVARYASLMTGIPYAFSAHAKDIYTTPSWDLTQKMAGAAWGTTCTRANWEFLAALYPAREQLELVYHGLDLTRFPPAPRRSATPPLTIVSVCRAVEKKGLGDLLSALAKLPRDLDWRFEHIGGGALTKRLKRRAETLGIAERITFHGSQPQDAVIEAYRRADVFVLASRIAKNGDRDGLPNVIMEAMAMGLPVVATDVSAIPEIVTEETGVLVAPQSPPALADAIMTLARDPARRARMGEAAAVRVREHFSPAPGIATLLRRIESTVGGRIAA